MLDEAAPRTTQMEHHHHALEQIWHIAARLDLLRITAGPEMEALGVDFKHVRQVLEAAQARSCVAPSTMRSSSRRSPHEDFRPWRCSRRDRELGRRGGPGGYVGLVTGRLTLDLGVGRRIQPLGPLGIDLLATAELVFEIAAAPYAERRPPILREKVEILERTDHMVLAAHRTQSAAD